MIVIGMSWPIPQTLCAGTWFGTDATTICLSETEVRSVKEFSAKCPANVPNPVNWIGVIDGEYDFRRCG